MKIVARYPTGWEVRATWHGAERVVFSGSIWQCLRWKEANMADLLGLCICGVRMVDGTEQACGRCNRLAS